MITVCFSDLQALDDLLMHTSGNNEHQEHELEYKEKIHYTAFACTRWFTYFLMYIFKCMLCPNKTQGFSIFCI